MTGENEVSGSSAGLTPTRVEQIWGVKAKGQAFGTLGLSAAQWDCGQMRPGTVERLRPACAATHVVSVWTKGSTASQLFLDNKARFKRIRRRGTFQLARAGEDLRVLLSETSGICLDLYVPADLLKRTLETEFDRVVASPELLPLNLESDPVVTRIADDISLEIENPGLCSRLSIDSSAIALSVRLLRGWSNISERIRSNETALTEFQLRRVTDFLSDSLSFDNSLSSLADLVGLSQFHFARAFRNSDRHRSA